MCLDPQTKIFAVIFSTKSLHSPLESLLAVIGSPRYLKGRWPSVKPVISRHFCWIVEQSPPKTMLDFSMFALNPEQIVNWWKASIIIWSEGGWALQNKIKSSAKSRCGRPNFLQLGWKANPWVWLAFLKTLDKYSMVRTKSRGERGSSCLSPLFPLKKSPYCPFMLIEKCTEVMHFIIHWINRWGNLRDSRSSFKKTLWTESKALWMSTFMMQQGGVCFLLRPLAKSWHSRTLNSNSLPFTNAPWPASMRLGMTSLSLKHKSLVIHLYSTLQHDIGLKSWAFCGCAIFSNKISLVCPKKLGRCPFEKNSFTAEHTSPPISSQQALKKPLLYPSGPGDLWLGMEKSTFLISASSKGLQRDIYWSVSNEGPISMMFVSMTALWWLLLPSKSV